jgi:L-ascorbate metabolism protein UlaG (beta-lactamase superfamily)
MTKELPDILEHIHWLGHDSFRIDGALIIYLDPWKLPIDSPEADLILVSHDHFDHCSTEDVESVRGDDTLLAANPSSVPNLKLPVRIMHPGEILEHRGVTIEAIPAYNIGKTFHPKGADHLGFILTIDGERVYFAGDTDIIPEMTGLTCDVALLPVSGTYVMNSEEAAEAVVVINTRVAIPMHYGAGVVGTIDDALKFQELSEVPVVILEREHGGSAPS